MPKMKTKKAAAKRFKRTGSGKIKRSSSKRGHLFLNRSSKQKRQLRAGGLVSKSDFERVSNVLPR